MTKFISPLGLVALLVLAAMGATATAQQFDPLQPGITDDQAAIERLAQPVEQIEADDPSQPTGIDLITLFTRGGYFMWPIGLMSLLVVAMSVERIVSFRPGRMVPRRLVRRLGELVREGQGSIDAERAFQLCREYPSSAARVVSAMLMRTGRPLAEIEAAASETAQREADANAGPIRWLNLAAAATPLMGLLGTVWGMIVAFHNSSNLTADRSRSEQLSEGIYTALVTTLAGLAVAIPAAILAQYLENRLGKLFRRIEVLAFSLAPSLEHYVGRQRMDSEARLRPINRALGSEQPPPPLAAARSNDAARPIDGERRTRGTPVSDASLGETTSGQR